MRVHFTVPAQQAGHAVFGERLGLRCVFCLRLLFLRCTNWILPGARMKTRISVLLTVLAALLSLPVRGAAQSVLAVRCADVRLDAASRIQACTAIIQDGASTDMELAVAYTNRGSALDQNGDYKAAIRDFDAALELSRTTLRPSTIAAARTSACVSTIGRLPTSMRRSALAPKRRCITVTAGQRILMPATSSARGATSTTRCFSIRQIQESGVADVWCT